MTKRRRMKMAEEQAAIDAAERDAAIEERKKRRDDLLAELGKASGDGPVEGTFGDEKPELEDMPFLLQEGAEVKPITGSILRSHQHVASDEDVNPIEKPTWDTEGTFVGSNPFQSLPANSDAVIFREDEDLCDDQNETDNEER